MAYIAKVNIETAARQYKPGEKIRRDKPVLNSALSAGMRHKARTGRNDSFFLALVIEEKFIIRIDFKPQFCNLAVIGQASQIFSCLHPIIIGVFQP